MRGRPTEMLQSQLARPTLGLFQRKVGLEARDGLSDPAGHARPTLHGSPGSPRWARRPPGQLVGSQIQGVGQAAILRRHRSKTLVEVLIPPSLQLCSQLATLFGGSILLAA